VSDTCPKCGQPFGFSKVNGFYCNTCTAKTPLPDEPEKESQPEQNLQKGTALILKHVQLYAGKDCGIIFLDKLLHAKRALRICSPWISENYLKRLIDLSNKSVKIFLVTSKDQYGYDIHKLLEENEHKIKYKFAPSDEVHSKIYVIDELFAVIGSANLTKNGLEKDQDNHVAYTKDENDVKKCSKIFESLYYKLPPLK